MHSHCIESATGFATICGEVAALCTMVAAGYRDLEAIAAVWGEAPTMSCTCCRPEGAAAS